MPVASANGKKFTFPEGTTPEQMAEAIDEFFSSQDQPPAQPAAPQQPPGIADRIMSVPGMKPLAEFSSAANRQVLGALDIVPGAINDVLAMTGTDYRVPGFEQNLGSQGGYMEEGLGRDVVQSAGSVLPAALGGGALIRGVAQGLPAMASGAESVGAGLLRQMGTTTAKGDAALGALSGAGSAVGGAAGEAVGGEQGRQIGQIAGGVIAPVGAIGAASAVSSRASKAADIAERITQGRADRDLAEFTIRPAKPAEPGAVNVGGKTVKVVADDAAKEAIKQGLDDGIVAAVKSVNDKTRDRLLRMVKISEQGKANALDGSVNRPADVAGESLAARLRFIKSVNERAGKNLDRVANTLRSETADMSTAAQKFGSALDDAGVSVTEGGGLNFRGSDFEDMQGVNKILNTVYRRANHIFETGNAYQAHRLKRFIDEQVSYGKGSADGLTGRAERLLKSLRADIDSSLDAQFPRYNRVNTQYSDTIQAINTFQDSAGTKVNLFGEIADKALGPVSRRLLSNAQSRATLMDAMKTLDDTALKYGAKFDDDIMMQVRFADELDSMFGAAAKTSLQGDAEKATKRGVAIATGQRNLTGIAADLAEAGINKARGINEQNAYKALKQLLARKAK